MNWTRINPTHPITPDDYMLFPMWVASESTGQVHFWRSFREMKDCEPLWELYTHCAPASECLPEPPPKPDPDAIACEAWCRPFTHEFPTYAECWKAALAWERSRAKPTDPKLEIDGDGWKVTIGSTVHRGLTLAQAFKTMERGGSIFAQ